MRFERASGVLLHPTSLSGSYGIGDLGPQVYRWLDFLSGAGCKLWQVLPLGPTGYGDSPYQCFSAFAGNPYLISPEFLIKENLLLAGDFDEVGDFPADRVDFGRLIPWKLRLLERAFLRFSSDPGPVRAEFDSFCIDNAAWLDDYALFMAIKEAMGGGSWEAWPENLRRREANAMQAAQKQYAGATALHKFYQFTFFRQWNAVRDEAHKKGVQIIGDIPIFVAHDSADVWSHPDLFFLDEQGKPSVVAGVPPDYFSPTGQLWGNPLYRWEVHRESGYAWWLDRIRAVLKLVDVVRVDHFRGFAGYWEVPAGNRTAEVGRWVPGPGADFFEVVKTGLNDPASPAGSDLPIIAEDLGLITPDVIALRDQFELPGMRILQFAFSGPDNPFLPHHYPQNCVAYTGTHDNDTARGWYQSAPQAEKNFACRYLGITPSQASKSFPWILIRSIWSSVSVFAIAPLQDFLALGPEARMNFPSRLGGNWEWRMNDEALSDELQGRIKELNFLYQR